MAAARSGSGVSASHDVATAAGGAPERFSSQRVRWLGHGEAATSTPATAYARAAATEATRRSPTSATRAFVSAMASGSTPSPSAAGGSQPMRASPSALSDAWSVAAASGRRASSAALGSTATSPASPASPVATAATSGATASASLSSALGGTSASSAQAPEGATCAPGPLHVSHYSSTPGMNPPSPLAAAAAL